MPLLYGCAGRLTAQNGGFRLGQVGDVMEFTRQISETLNTAVHAGLGRIVALHHRSSTSHQIH
jgi:hypothetical protein